MFGEGHTDGDQDDEYTAPISYCTVCGWSTWDPEDTRGDCESCDSRGQQ